MNTAIRHSRITTLVIFLLVLSIAAVASTPPATVQPLNERRISFNQGWKFLNSAAEGAEAPGFDDSQWRDIRLPHDWAIEGPFDAKMNPHTGALPISGIGWYRKSFVLPSDLKGRVFTIEFDGAMSNAVVWITAKNWVDAPTDIAHSRSI